ncbi:MAG: ATP-grasp domain-containing protein [Pseudomonadota bacterium]
MNILFLEPAFPSNQRAFVRALREIGANVMGIGERPYEWLDDEVKSWLGGYWQIQSVTDEPHLEWAVREAQRHHWIDRLEATVEAHILPAAHVRERTGIPGISPRTAFLCRDKIAMKDVLRRAGVPTAASAGVSSRAEADAFAREVGFPVILKPRDAAGAAGTYRADTPQELEAVLRQSGVADGAPAAMEEFVEGHEAFYDTLTVAGRVEIDFISHYHPNVLEAMRTRWISPQIVATNRMDAPAYAEVKDMGRRVIDALGITTAATHMEWFFGPKGLKFSEIGCRPPGVGQWDSYAAAGSFDIYRAWAEAVCHLYTDLRPNRGHAAGIVALRPERDGRIAGYSGTDRFFERHGHLVVGQHFPEPGTPTQGVEAGYMANAWLRLRHPDVDTLRAILTEAGEQITVHAR